MSKSSDALSIVNRRLDIMRHQFMFRLHRSPRSLLSGLALAGALAASAAPAAEFDVRGLPADQPVIAIVRVPTPWYAPRFLVTSKMRDTIPQYEALEGLAFKAYSFDAASGEFGGLYLWENPVAAKAWFNDAWFDRVRRERGAEGKVVAYSAVASIDLVPGGTPKATASAAVATLIWQPDGARVPDDAGSLAAAIRAAGDVSGLMRVHAVVTAGRRAGLLYLWQDAASADRFLARTAPAGASVERFDVPILMPRAKSLQSLAGDRYRQVR